MTIEMVFDFKTLQLLYTYVYKTCISIHYKVIDWVGKYKRQAPTGKFNRVCYKLYQPLQIYTDVVVVPHTNGSKFSLVHVLYKMQGRMD